METKWTKGPWMTAARPSSVVGLPVVAQSGRSIASITFFELGDRFAQHDVESQANANLIAAGPTLYEALADTRRKFHAALVSSGTDPEFADIACEYADAALAKARGE